MVVGYEAELSGVNEATNKKSLLVDGLSSSESIPQFANNRLVQALFNHADFTSVMVYAGCIAPGAGNIKQ